MIELKVEDVGAFALVGAVMHQFPQRAPHSIDDEIKIITRSFNLGVDIMGEMLALSKFFPNAKISVFRDGTRELWGGKAKKE